MCISWKAHHGSGSYSTVWFGISCQYCGHTFKITDQRNRGIDTDAPFELYYSHGAEFRLISRHTVLKGAKAAAESHR